jgi:hypothetical protein
VKKGEWNLGTVQGRENFNAVITQMVLAGEDTYVKIMQGKRTVSQNAMIYSLYQQAGAQSEDQSIVDVRRMCKLHYGIPILRANDPEFCDFYDRLIKHSFTTEDKLLLMDHLEVTSKFNKEMGTEYIDTVIREYSQQGFCMIHPSESYGR